MDEEMFQNVLNKASKYPKPDVKYTYGTAGFRLKAELLPSVMYRMGLLAVLRSRACGNQTIGLMVTASHNAVQDNGVKLIDPMGEMLEAAWENHATELANSEDIGQCLRDLTKRVKSTCQDWSNDGNIVLARDTRPSGVELVQSALDAAKAFRGKFKDLGILTTPQLHYIVRCTNDPDYGKASEEGYYQKISSAFLKLTKSLTLSSINIDGANGVGALKFAAMGKYLENALPMRVYNDGTSGELNKNCGADFVKVSQKAPEGLEMIVGEKYASVDGDADRIVYFYLDETGSFRLLDGDKISTLIAGFFKDILVSSRLTLERGLGVVQTAYANGSSTAYLDSHLAVPVACVKTGVKHLHKKANDFDIGVYFEANGHGTVLFSDDFKAKLNEALLGAETLPEIRVKLEDLKALMELVNETVGDSISDMLIVEAILAKKGWSLKDWDQCYVDLPNRQRKIQVNDRTVVVTTDAERKVTLPKGLQPEIDKLVAGVKNGRSFVRPSGTEDVVRVYAEAATREEAESLALAVARKVYDLAGGVGVKPH